MRTLSTDDGRVLLIVDAATYERAMADVLTHELLRRALRAEVIPALALYQPTPTHESPEMNRTLRALLPGLALAALGAPAAGVFIPEARPFFRHTPRTSSGFHRSTARWWPAKKTPSDFVALGIADAKRARKNAARLVQVQRAAG